MPIFIRSIAIIGTGNVATHLGKAFVQAGVEIAHIAGRDTEKAAALATELGVASSSSISNSLPHADLYLIAVKDDAIGMVAKEIFAPGRNLAHTAGAVISEILRFDHNHFGVIWPMQTLTKNNAIDLSQTLMAVTGSDDKIQTALGELMRKISSRVLEVSDEQRAVLHLSAVWINNFTNHMYDIAAQLLKDNNLPFDVFFPLIEEHISKLHSLSPDQLQTGPARRGDQSTLLKHTKMLSNYPEWQKLYDAISNSILNKFLKQ